MTISATFWAFNSTGVSPVGKLLLIYCADRWRGDAGEDEWARLSLDEFASWAGCDHIDAVVAVTELQEFGYVTRSRYDDESDNIFLKLSFTEERAAFFGPERKTIPKPVRRFVLERDGFACVGCGADDNLHIDHIIPVVRGGGNNLQNLQILCGSCNSSKRAKTMEEWLAWRDAAGKASQERLA